MKILQLAKYYPPIYGGIELVEKMITKVHSENRDEIFIHAFDKTNFFEHGEFNENIFRIKENINIIGAPISFKYIFNFKKMISSLKLDRIYVHLPNPFMHELLRLNYSFLKKNKIEIVAVYHSDIINKGFIGFIYNAYFKYSSYVYDKIVVSSNNLWNSSGILMNISSSKKVVIPFCIEEVAGNSDDVAKVKNRLISIGRLVPYKGFEFLIRTFNDTEFELNIVGNGPLLNYLQSIASKNIKFHTNLNHIKKNELLKSSEYLVVGSLNRAEAYGMTIVEAFYYGIPVIAPKINSGVTFLVQDKITGYVYNIADQEMLLNITRNAFKNQNDQEKIKGNIEEFYSNTLSYNSFRKGLLQI